MVPPQSSIVRLMWSNAARAVPMMWLDVLATAVVNQTWIVYRGAEFTTWLLLMSLMSIGYLPLRRRHVDGSAISRLAETWLCYTVQWAAFRLILYPLHGLATVALLSLFCLPTPVAIRWMPLLSVAPPALMYVGYAAFKKKLRGPVAVTTGQFSDESLEGVTTNTNVSNMRPLDSIYASLLLPPNQPPPTTSTTLATVTVQLVPRRHTLLHCMPPTQSSFQMMPVETNQCDIRAQSQTTDPVTRSDPMEVAAPRSDEPSSNIIIHPPPSEQTVEAPRVPVTCQCRESLCLLTTHNNSSAAAQTAPGFHSELPCEKTSSRSSEAQTDLPSRASSSDYTEQRPSATASLLNTLLANTLSLMPPDEAMAYAMGVPLGFGGRIKSEANPRLVVSPIARTAMEHFRTRDEDAWFTQSEQYYVERLGTFNKIWRLLRSLK